jgi:predicted TIM-barrel fold metal-dependent hydrolase
MNRRRYLAALLFFPSLWAEAQPLADHHQHLFSPSATALSGGSVKAVSATDLIGFLDEAGIGRAAVLSLAYQYGNPNRAPVEDEYAKVRAENEWTSREVAQFPERLRGFCSFNPLKDYALQELERCAQDPNLRHGLKMHFGNSDVDLENPEHVAKLRAVLEAASGHGMAVLLHIRPSVSRQRPYGAGPAKIFLEEILPAAPDVVVQIAHLAGAGGYDDPAIDEALGVYAEAVARNDVRMANVFFDVSGVAGIGEWRGRTERIALRIRQLGVQRVLFGSDGTPDLLRPRDAWAAIRELPLTDDEFGVIVNNVAPYMR